MSGPVSAVVVDAGLAAKWVLIEPQRAEAMRLLMGWRCAGLICLVPSLFLSEISTPLLKLRRQNAITAADARRARDDLLLAVSIMPDDASLTMRALEIADALALRTAHDSLYIALAEQEGCELWTADERFFNVARGRFPRVRWLGEVATTRRP